MLYDFRYKTKDQYLKNLEEMIKNKSYDDDEYDDLMDEFVLFCEVSGSGR